MASRREPVQVGSPKKPAGVMPITPRHLHRRGGIWWHRVTVPPQLRPIIGKVELLRSLKTGDLARARGAAVIAEARAQAVIDKARRQFEAEHADIVELSEPEPWSLAVEWLLNAEKRTPVDKTPQELVAEAESTIFGVAGDNEHLLVRAETIDTLREHAIGELTPESTNRLLGFMSQAIIEHAKRILVRHSDRTLNLNSRFSDAKPNNLPAISFEECVRRFRTKYQKPNRAEKTRTSEFAQDKLFFDCFGARTPVRLVGREEVIRFEEALNRLPSNATRRGITMKDALESSIPLGPPMAARTKNEHLDALRAIFKFAIAEGYIVPPSPMGAGKRHPDEVAARDKRIPFTDEKVRTIFANLPPSMFWVTAIAAFSGMRLSEVTQLRATDILIDDITVISVNTDEGKSVKSPSGVRIVPVHKELLRAGFNELVEKTRKRGADARLFEELYTAKHPSGAFSKRFADLLDKLNIIDKRLVFHSWRHGAKQALENAGVPLDRIEALGGWSGANRGASSNYGGEPPLPLLKKAIDSIEFAGLKLP